MIIRSLILPLLALLCSYFSHVGTISPLDFLVKADRGNTKGYPQILENGLINALHRVNHSHVKDFNDPELIAYAWARMDQTYRQWMGTDLNQSKPTMKLLIKHSNISNECTSAIWKWFDELGNLNAQAVRVWNAWGTLPSGIFEGTFTDLGSYRQCFNAGDFDTRYCMLDFQPLIPPRPRFHSIFKGPLTIKNGTLSGRNFGNYRDLFERVSSGEKSLRQFVAHSFPSDRFMGESELAVHQSLAKSNLTHRYNSSTTRNSIMVEFVKRAQYFYYVRLRIGSCWPSECSVSDIQAMTTSFGVAAVLQATPVTCLSKDEPYFKLNRYQLVSVIVLGSLAAISLFVSLLDKFLDLDWYQVDRGSIQDSILSIWSIQRNWVRLISPSSVSTQETPDSTESPHHRPVRQLGCLHGLKCLSMIWVIFGHTLLDSDYQSFTHGFKVVDEDIVNPFIYPLLNPNFSVDTFFLINGLLSSYIMFSLKVKLNAVVYTLARYIRLTPQLLIVILIYFLIPQLGQGPFFKSSTQHHVENCYKNWWLNLLYLQCYYDREHLCILPSWWLSIEMTFHLASLFVIHLLIMDSRIGLIANFATTAAFIGFGSYVHYTNGFAISYLASIPQRYEITEQTIKFFHRPYPHAASFFIGLAIGHFLARTKLRIIPKWQAVLGWSFATLCFLACTYGPYFWHVGLPYNQLEATVYFNLLQILWPIGIGWTIIACVLGRGGFVEKFLSAAIFVPAGRVTYMTYLSHMVVIYLRAGTNIGLIEPSPYNWTYEIVGNLFLSLLLSTILSLVYEAPILNLQKMLMTKKYRPLQVSNDPKPNIARSLMEVSETVKSSKNGHRMSEDCTNT